MRILLVEDDKLVRIPLRDALLDAGHSVEEAVNGTAALAAISGDSFDLLLSDIRLPGADGLEIFERLRAGQPACAAILMTAYGRVEDAVRVMRDGASDYITKPFDTAELLLRIERLQGEAQFRQALASGEHDACGDDQARSQRMVGDSAAMQQVKQRIKAAASAGVCVLISGETGTGKELCVQMLHCRRGRGGPLVVVNCAAIPGELFEAEMFGHERGAFTGADRKRQGKFKAANGGTLFLDEVGELPLEHQAKLLRAIETGTFEPVGSSKTVASDVWVVGATNRDLSAHVEAGSFRQDLYYRLNVIEIQVPPLRERRGDIPLLVSDFLRAAALRQKFEMPELSPSAISALMTHPYPGNVRELLHALEHGLALAQGEAISVEHLPAPFQGPMGSPGDGAEGQLPLGKAIKQFEQSYIRRVLEQAEGKKSEAARLLGISRKSLWQKLKQD